MSRFLTQDNRQSKECSDIEGKLMRRGGRLSERLTARERLGRQNKWLTFAVHRDSPSLVIMFCNCRIISKLPARHLCVVNHVCTSVLHCFVQSSLPCFLTFCHSGTYPYILLHFYCLYNYNLTISIGFALRCVLWNILKDLGMYA